MACHTPSLKKVKKARGNAITQPQSHPIKENVEFRDGMGPRLANDISPCFFTFLRDGVYDRPSLNLLSFSEKIFASCL